MWETTPFTGSGVSGFSQLKSGDSRSEHGRGRTVGLGTGTCLFRVPKKKFPFIYCYSVLKGIDHYPTCKFTTFLVRDFGFYHGFCRLVLPSLTSWTHVEPPFFISPVSRRPHLISMKVCILLKFLNGVNTGKTTSVTRFSHLLPHSVLFLSVL